MWTLNKHPLNAYGTAGHAAKRDTSWVIKTVEKGQVKVLDVAWADSAGNVYYPDKGAGTIPIYSVSQVGGLGGLGWIRSDDNLSNSIITNAPSLSAQTGVNNVLTFDKAGEKHTLRININGELVKYITEITSSPVNFQFTQDEVNKILDLMPNVTASDVEYILTTYEGSNIIGDFSRSTKRITIPFDVKPTIDNIVITPINAVDGKLYEKKSSVKVAPSCRPGRGAKINNVFIWVGDFLGLDNPYTSQPFSSSGEIPIRVMVTDTRMRSAQASTTVQVLPYQGISLSNLTAERVLDENATTDYVRVAYQGKAYELDSQKQITVKVEYQERGQTNWSLAGSNSIGVIANNYSSYFDIQDLSDSKSFNIRVTFTDGLGNTYPFETTVGTANFPVTFGKHGVGVGVMFDNNKNASLQVGERGALFTGNVGAIFNGSAVIKKYLFFNEGFSNRFNISWDSLKQGATINVNNKGALLVTETDVSFNGKSLLNQTIEQPKSDIVDYMNKSYGGYILYSNGILHQWGRADLSNQTYSFDYHKPFSAPPMVQLSSSNSAGAWPLAQLDSATATTCKFRMLNGSTGQIYNGAYTIHWVAMGMG